MVIGKTKAVSETKTFRDLLADEKGGDMAMDTDALARLMIRLAGAIVWAMYNHKTYQETVEQGELAWQKIKASD